MLPVGNMETVIFYMYNFYTLPCMYLHTRTFFTLADTTSIPMGAMYLHARMFCTLVHTSIPVCAMYLHARTFCTLAHTTSIPVCAMYLYAGTFCTLSDTILYPLRAPIFTVTTEVWPRAYLAVITNNYNVRIEVVLIEVVLIEGFLTTTTIMFNRL